MIKMMINETGWISITNDELSHWLHSINHEYSSASQFAMALDQMNMQQDYIHFPPKVSNNDQNEKQ